jgi:hypothetical protein
MGLKSLITRLWKWLDIAELIVFYFCVTWIYWTVMFLCALWLHGSPFNLPTIATATVFNLIYVALGYPEVD